MSTPHTGSRIDVRYAEPSGPHLVVVLPALNEEATVVEVITAVPRRLAGFGRVTVVVVDDGSWDQTADLAESAGAIVVRHPCNRGVGAALATGIDRALSIGADLIVSMDSDGQFNAADIPKLIRPILEDGYGFVTCTRFGGQHSMAAMPWAKRWGNRMMCRIVNAIVRGGGFTDVSCGFRAYSRDVALRLVLFGRFTYTQETFIDLAAKDIPMTEVPLPVRPVREHGKSRVASSLLRYGIRASLILFRSMRDTRPLVFFGMLALLFLALGLALFGFVTLWWLYTGHTSPWTSLLTLATSASVVGVSSGVMALVADQIGRGRKLLEEALYYQRRQYYHDISSGLPSPGRSWDALEASGGPLQARSAEESRTPVSLGAAKQDGRQGCHAPLAERRS